MNSFSALQHPTPQLSAPAPRPCALRLALEQVLARRDEREHAAGVARDDEAVRAYRSGDYPASPVPSTDSEVDTVDVTASEPSDEEEEAPAPVRVPFGIQWEHCQDVYLQQLVRFYGRKWLRISHELNSAFKGRTFTSAAVRNRHVRLSRPRPRRRPRGVRM